MQAFTVKPIAKTTAIIAALLLYHATPVTPWPMLRTISDRYENRLKHIPCTTLRAAPRVYSRWSPRKHLQMIFKTQGPLKHGVALCVYRSQLIALCSLLSACSPQLRMVKEPSVEQIPDYRWAATAPDGLTVTVHTVLVRNDPGSWVRDADWDEYILTVKNFSRSAMKIEFLRLYSPYLPASQQSSLALQQLEDQSHDTLHKVRDVTVVAGSGALAAGATVAATAGAGYIGAAAAVPAAMLTLPYLQYSVDQTVERRHLEHEDRSLIELTILERGMHLPLAIPPDGEATRSAFFPLTPAPNRLVIDYRVDGDRRSLEVPLTALAQLHLKPGHSPQ